MESIDISWATMLKIVTVSIGTYIVLPAFLVLRDLLLHWIIGKLILTKELNILIMVCEGDRWFINNRYNKSTKISYGANSIYCEIDGEPVTKEKFEEYEKGKNFHVGRFEYADSKIAFRHNLLTWLTKHYEQAGGGNPIPRLREQYYQTAGANENRST